MCDSTLACYNNGIETEDTLPNTHLDHLEDLIFTSKRQTLSVLREIFMGVRLSVKWDGAPAIVFGTDPRNGKFFVGTKSVFNKVNVKICYTYEDSDKYYKGNVADILHHLHHLPRVWLSSSWIVSGSVLLPAVGIAFKTRRDIILAPYLL